MSWAAAMLIAVAPKKLRRSWLIGSDTLIGSIRKPPYSVICGGSAQGESKSLRARAEKFDFELSIHDGFGLPDQLRVSGGEFSRWLRILARKLAVVARRIAGPRDDLLRPTLLVAARRSGNGRLGHSVAEFGARAIVA
jgi:hypothetical protein